MNADMQSEISAMSVEDAKREWAIYQDLKHRTKAKSSFLDFITYTKPDYKLWWHNKALADILDKFEKRELTRVIINMPPRHGKSEQVSRRLPAYILGRNPDARVIAASYSTGLASKMNRDVQRVIESKSYQNVFADTDLMGHMMRRKPTKDWVRNNSGFEVVERKGVYLSVGRGSGVTGAGADYIIVDDPIKDHVEANSPLTRQRTWEWWTSTLTSRAESDDRGRDCAMLVTMTRWHHDDLVGRLVELEKKDPEADKWTVFTLPALKDDTQSMDCDHREFGEALWPAKRDRKALLRIKASNGTKVFNALYQQSPSSGEGEIVKRSHLNYYTSLPEMQHYVQSWDFSFEEGASNDFTVGQLWGISGPHFYLISQVRDKMSITAQLQSVSNMSAKQPRAYSKLVEKKANGAAILDLLKSKIAGLTAVEPKTSKSARLDASSPVFEAGNVWLPDPSIAPWISDYVEELVTFPRAANDDQVDATTQFILWAVNKTVSAYSKDMVQNKGKTIIGGQT